jgi:hypothetical protein
MPKRVYIVIAEERPNVISPISLKFQWEIVKNNLDYDTGFTEQQYAISDAAI